MAATGLLLAVLVCSAAFNLQTGASQASAWSVAASLLGADGGLAPHERLIVLDIRLPRAVLGMLIGAGLAVSGAVMQGLFRNPLADPGIIGVSAGASLGAVSIIVLGGGLLAPLTIVLGTASLPFAAFVGALGTTFLLYGIASRHGQTSVATMLLAGIAIAALAFAFTGVLVFLADDRQLRDLTFWSLGSLAGASWAKIATAGPIIALALLAMPFLARSLNGLALGEAAAGHLGISVQLAKNAAIVAVAAATGAAVSVAGGIGFIGIVVPHLLRLVIGPDNRFLLPAAALLGASALLLADAVARTVAAPAELPIGIVTALLGAPFFLWILLRNRNVLDL
jgi:iron complex transport system permease protein